MTRQVPSTPDEDFKRPAQRQAQAADRKPPNADKAWWKKPISISTPAEEAPGGGRGQRGPIPRQRYKKAPAIKRG